MSNSLNIKYAVVGEFDELSIEYVEAQVGERLESHDSLYKGEYWLLRIEDPKLNIELRLNIDPMYDPVSDPKEEYYFDYKNKDCALLVDVDGEPILVKELGQKIAKNSKFRLITANS